jgi:hypothetical protein
MPIVDLPPLRVDVHRAIFQTKPLLLLALDRLRDDDAQRRADAETVLSLVLLYLRKKYALMPEEAMPALARLRK